MITQAGIYKLDLYENKYFVPTYDANGKITSFTYSGEVINLETNENEPKYSNDLSPGENNNIINDTTLNFNLNGLDPDVYNEIEKLQQSIYGWISVIEFMDNQKYIILEPFFPEVGTLNAQVSHTFNIDMKPRVNTVLQLVEYTP